MNSFMLVQELPHRRAPLPFFFLIVASALSSIFPCIELANFEVTLFDIPIAVAILWFGTPAALLLVAIGALMGLIFWGAAELNSWLALYWNSLLLVWFVHLARQNLPTLSLNVTGLVYWLSIGTPLSFIMFWQQNFDSEYAFVATGYRLYSGMAAITLSVSLHFMVVVVQHRLPSWLFGNHQSFKVRMRDITGSAAMTATAFPLILALWGMANSEIEARIESLFSASDARFESLAQTASANLMEQRAAVNNLAKLTLQLSQGDNTDQQSLNNSLLSALAINDALGAVIKLDSDSAPHISSGILSLGISSEDLLTKLAESDSLASVQLTDDKEGAVGFVVSKKYPQVFIVYENPVKLWDSLYRSDMLGMMGSSNSRGMIDRVSHFHGPSAQQLYGIADDARIIKQEYDYAIWIPPARDKDQGRQFDRVRELKNSYITFQASDELINAFDLDLYDVDCFRYTVDFWSYIYPTLHTASLSIVIGAALLLALISLIEFSIARFSAPFAQLGDAMERFSQTSQSDQLQIYNFDVRGTTSLFQRLATGFNEMEHAVTTSTARVKAINVSYESLLNQAKLAFIAIDGAGRIAFTNPAADALLSSTQSWIEKAIDALETDEVAPINFQHQGQSYDLLVAQAPRVNLNGETDGLWLIASDVSSLKQAERQLLTAQRLSTLGQLTAGMAHEINQPLQAMTLAVANLKRLLKEPLAENPKASHKLEAFSGHLYKIANLIKFMKSHGGQGSTLETEFEPRAVVAAVISQQKEEYKNTLQIDLVDTNDVACYVKGDPQQFELVITHLLRNAHDAGCVNHDRSIHKIELSLAQNEDQLIFAAADDCGGIPQDALPYVFDPFYTTKDPDKGMGLGLSVSQGIVLSMGGEIRAENTDTGATFTITLPISTS